MSLSKSSQAFILDSQNNGPLPSTGFYIYTYQSEKMYAELSPILIALQSES